MERKLKKEVRIGNIKIGGNNPVWVQSMCNTDTRNVEATIKQISVLEEAGCEIIRVAVPDHEAAAAVANIKKAIHIPLVADIHFDHDLALECIRNGVDAVRINPGNIGSKERVKKVCDAAKNAGIPIRIGVNGGSLAKDIIEKYHGVNADALVESAVNEISVLDECNFSAAVVSIKVSHVPMMIEAYRKFNEISDIPLHLGVTEAGLPGEGTVKSAVGIGTLLAEGIGDTIRVSLTSNPLDEIYAAYDILKCLGLRKHGVEIISCPTCGRTQIDLISIANEVKERLKNVDKNIKVAVMGCAVNGVGEGRDADIGIAGGKGSGILFSHGEIIRKVNEDKLVEELIKEVEKL